MIHQPITAARPLDDRDTCPDCGSVAQGRGYFGSMYCGLCERSVPEVSPDGRSVGL